MKLILKVFIIVLSVNNYIAGQTLQDIPDQLTETGSYEVLNLNDFITGSNCYEFDVFPSSIASSGETGHPNLLDIEYEDARENMTVTMKINYAGFNLGQDAQDAIWVYDQQDNLVEVNDSYVDPFNPDEHIFYLNVRGNFDNYLAKVVFYSGVLETTFEYLDVFEYGHNKVLGTALEPFVIDEAPLHFNFNGFNNSITAVVVDEDFNGSMCLDIVAIDCDGEEIGSDQVCYEYGDLECEDHLILSQAQIAQEIMQLFSARFSISSDAIIENTQEIHFSANESVLLLPGFEVKLGSEFNADNNGCQ